MVKDLVFHHHTSLGDHYICNGIAHNYAKDCETLHIPCSEGNYETVNCLYSDFDNIVVHPMTFQSPISKHEVDGLAAKEGWEVTRIGFEKVYYRRFHRVNSPGVEGISVNFDRQFYEEANLLYRKRYEDFYLPKEIPNVDKVYHELVGDADEYIILHKNSSLRDDYPVELWSWRQGKFNKNIKIVEIQKGQTSNMFSYMKVIENAKEIHCVDSSFFCLVDSVSSKLQGELFYHDMRVNSHVQVHCNFSVPKWNVMSYDFVI